MIRLFLFSFFLFLCLYTQAQSPLLWDKYYLESGNEWINDINVDDKGQIWFTGYIAYPPKSYREGDIWYGKLDENGNKVWTANWGNEGLDYGKCFLPVKDGNAFLVGNAGWSGKGYQGGQAFYAWIQGTEMTSHDFFGDNEPDNFEKAIVCHDGTVLAGGMYHKGYDNMALVRFSPERKILALHKYYFSDYDFMNDFIEKENGNIVVVGTSGIGTYSDLLMFEVDPQLNVIWHNIVDLADVESLQSVCLTQDGGYMICGDRYDRDLGRSKAWYAKTDSMGEIKWEREVSNLPRENTVVKMSAYGNGLYVMARNTYGDSPDQNISNNQDISFIVFNEKGETKWDYTFASPQIEYMNDLDVGEKGKVYVAGELLKDDTAKTGFVYCFDPQLQSTSVVSNKNPNYINLFVYDKADQSPLNATVKVKHEDGSTELVKTNDKGIATLFLKKGERCSITLEALGYSSLEDVVALPAEGVKQENKYYLVRAKSGTTVVMKSVGFERSTTKLLPGSYEELDRLAKFMQAHPEVKIELSGHTDNGGVPKANQLLSEERVATVKNYLVSKGVSADRIIGKGYGGRKPIAPNDSEENKSKNRRVEVKIIG